MEVIQVGKKTKMKTLTQRLIKQFLEQGWRELEAVGATQSIRRWCA